MIPKRALIAALRLVDKAEIIIREKIEAIGLEGVAVRIEHVIVRPYAPSVWLECRRKIFWNELSKRRDRTWALCNLETWEATAREAAAALKKKAAR